MNIVFTHDLHDHIEEYPVLENGKIIKIGGYERLNNEIQNILKEDRETLVLDAGDYSMGTLFQTIYDKENPSLRLLGKMGFDATTLGNHEFDYRAKGIANSLINAKKTGENLPELLVSNIDFEDFENVNKEEVENLEEAFKEYGAKEYTIIEKNGVKIGLFGLMGADSISNAPMAGVNFSDPIEKAKEITNILKEKNVDIIICLSHSGTWEDKKKSEDEIMAKEVKDIDLIISGHTHTELHQPIIAGNTIIASSGSYGKYLGNIQLKQKDDKWNIKDYTLNKLDKISETDNLKEQIDYYKEKVQEEYLNSFNLEFDEIIGKVDFNFTPEAELGKEHREEPLGNLITDSYIHTVKEIEGDKYKEITAAIVPYGTIRGSLSKGDITVSDIFNISSLGIGPDKVPGYPLIEVYLTGKELKTTAEVDSSIQPIMDVAQLYMSGIEYKFNPNRLIFNKLTEIQIVDEDGISKEIVDDELYRVVAGLYTAQMLSIVKDQSFGLMSIIPKDSKGNEIENFENFIIYDSNDKEVKEWYALANYIQSFEKDGNISKIPEEYSKPLGRKIVDDNKNILEILKNPNGIGKSLYAIVMVIILGIAFLVRFIIKKFKIKKSSK